MLTEKMLREIEARCSDATAGPWENDPYPAAHVPKEVIFPREGISDPRAIVKHFPDGAEQGIAIRVQTKKDAAFIAHSRSDVPALVAEVRRLWDEVDELREEIEDGKRMNKIESAEFYADMKAGK